MTYVEALAPSKRSVAKQLIRLLLSHTTSVP